MDRLSDRLWSVHGSLGSTVCLPLGCKTAVPQFSGTAGTLQSIPGEKLSRNELALRQTLFHHWEGTVVPDIISQDQLLALLYRHQEYPKSASGNLQQCDELPTT